MLNSVGDVIYVGKAKNLQKRISSYFFGKKDLKTTQLISNVDDITITVTRNEEEAFLLELELIKQLQPKYNIIFKDAKSYPYIIITTADDYPQLTFYRGARLDGSQYYGPYPSVRAAREGLELLQKIFCLRSCDATTFKNRKRPCLQHQIKRCSAPCVGYINKHDYSVDVENAKQFLQGRTNQVIDSLIVKMDAAAKELLYERALQLREQIVTLRKIQKHQVIIDSDYNVNVDVLGVYCANEKACVHLLCIRGGRILGSKQYFPQQQDFLIGNKISNAVAVNLDDLVPNWQANTSQQLDIEQIPIESEILEAFILQHYSNCQNDQQWPSELIVPIELTNQEALAAVVSQLHSKKIKINHYSNGTKVEWIKMAEESAKEALLAAVEKTRSLQASFTELEQQLGLNLPLERIECFDVSHTQGISTVGACVVFSPSGALKTDYRRYNIKTANAGDDYAALAEMLERRYINFKSLNCLHATLVIIDGGKGQLAVAEEIIQNKLNLSGVKLISVAKGRQRKIGMEILYLSSKGNRLELRQDSGALRLIQQIRDEAHRFAITGHRAKRAKNMLHSSLEKIDGVGAKRRLELLKQFGGFKEVALATAEELAKVRGISKKLAQRIYDALHKQK